MENIIKQLKNGAKHTRLSVSEKAEMKSALLRHVEANPVRSELLLRHQFVKGDKSILSPFQINNLRNKKTMPLLVIMGLLMGGSASFAAENAVPGDVLFPVKVHVNEQVRGAVAVSPKAKAEWEVRLVERRLEEVEKLATTPSALPEAQQVAVQNLSDYTKHVEDRISKFEDDEDSEDALETALNLANVLGAHETILAGLTSASSATSTSAIAGATASTTATTLATSTATTTASAVAGTSATVAQGDLASLREVLSKLRESRGHAEEKHKELKKKYHQEDDEDEQGGDNDNDADNVVPSNWTPTPASSPAQTSTSTASGTATSTPAVVPQGIRIGDHEDALKSRGETKKTEKSEEKKRQKEGTRDEEIRSTPTALTTSAVSATSISTSTLPKTENHTEAEKANDND